MNISILVQDEKPDIHEALKSCFVKENIEYQVLYTADEKATRDILGNESVNFLVCPLGLLTGYSSQLLQEHPDLVRIALVKENERESVAKSFPHVHHFINQPVDVKTLKSYIQRTAGIRQVIGPDAICRLCTHINDLPSLPAVVYRVIEELSCPDPSVARIAYLIEHDSLITSRILQIVNSPALALGNRIYGIEQAIALLGLEMTKTIVLYAGIHNYLHSPVHILATAESINKNSFDVGNLALKIALAETGDYNLAQQAKMAGILNNIGYMLLLNNPQTQTELKNILTAEKITLLEAEQLLTGITHAELGAYFLGIRGFALPILEAVAYYYRPQARPNKHFNTLTALHVAHGLSPSPLKSIIPCKKLELDLPYLDKLGLLNRIATWKSIAEDFYAKM